jgi:hypothetical protein
MGLDRSCRLSHAVLQARQRAVTNHANVSGREPHRFTDLVRVAIVDERGEHDGAVARLQPTQAFLEPAVIERLRRLVAPFEKPGDGARPPTW